MPARMQPVEVGHAVDAEQHRLAIDHERVRAVLQCGLGDQGITISPVVAVAGEQPYRACRRAGRSGDSRDRGVDRLDSFANF